MGTVRISLFVALCILQAHSHDRPYDMSQHCSEQMYMIINTASLLVMTEGEIQTGAQCDVHITSNWVAGPGHSDDDWLMVLIEDLNMPCESQTKLQFFNGSTASNNTISYPPDICSDNPYQAWYLVKSRTMGIRLTAGDHRNVKLKIVVTATSFDKEQNGDDFVCANNLRIMSSLKCDGDNNCGDFSDEVVEDCPYSKKFSKDLEKSYKDLEKSKKTLGMGLGLGLGLPLFLIIVVGVGWICYKRKSH